MLLNFLKNFADPRYQSSYSSKYGQRKYICEIQKMINKENPENVLEIHLDDLEDYFTSKGDKARKMLKGIT